MIRKQRAALECPTFPVNPREFRAPEVCLAASLTGRRVETRTVAFNNTDSKSHQEP